MSDPTTDQQPGATPSEAQNPQAEHMIPKARFDEVNAKLRRLEQEAAQREQAQREAAEREAAAKGEFEKLANERGQRLSQVEQEAKRTAEQVEAYAAEMERQIKARLRALPDAIKAMAPDGDTLARFAWLEKAEAAAAEFTPAAPRGTPTGARGTVAPANGAADLVARKRQSSDYSL